jgi:hypothetical protein
MRRTITLLASTAALVAGITGSASAATLYTNAAHTTPVAVGTTLTAAVTPGALFTINNPAGPIDACQPNKTLQVTQNSGGVFKANNLGGRMNCYNAWAETGGVLQVSGSSTTVGSNKSWASTTLTGTLSLGAGSSSENFTTGISARQPIAGGSPVSIVLNNAATIGPGVLTNGTETGTYNIAGSYSLG